MANKDYLAILTKWGVQGWNEWRAANSEQEVDLSGANLSSAKLQGVDLSGAVLCQAQLTEADLSYANLRKTNFSFAELWSTNFCGSDLRQAIFQTSRLQNTNFCNANLSAALFVHVNFIRTNVRDADLTRSHVVNSSFNDLDLEGVKGLETITHSGPSSVGIDTIYRSHAKIPQIFLRGCGVPESLISYIPSLVSGDDGIQFYSCFISYSTKDEEFAKRLHERMRSSNLRVWFAPEDIQAGIKLYEQIETAIRVYDKLLIVLSDASLQSEWVMTELRRARRAERESGRRKLFPLRLVNFERLRDWECFDADSGKDLAVELREYFIPDFSHWKENAPFEKAFAKLLNDLKSDLTTVDNKI